MKPSLLKTVKIPLGEASEAKMRRISLSSDRPTIQRCISGMLEDVKDQVINESISNVFFQVDESTDVTSCARFLVFVRYIDSGDIEAELLFSEKLPSATTNADVREK